jgi:hypothetical protein
MKSNKYFIIGCGRSGTHLLGSILVSNNHFAGTVRDVKSKNSRIGRIRNLCETVIYYPKKASKHLNSIYSGYTALHNAYKPKNYVDKTHGLIWLAESMASKFEDAFFIGIERASYPLIASYLKKGLMQGKRDRSSWKNYPIPTRPSGITKEISKFYGRLPIESRAALVWLSHKIQMEKLKNKLGKRLHVVNYDNLLNNFVGEVNELSAFIGVNFTYPANKINRKTNQKYKKQFTAKNIENINKIINDEKIKEYLVNTL